MTYPPTHTLEARRHAAVARQRPAPKRTTGLGGSVRAAKQCLTVNPAGTFQAVRLGRRGSACIDSLVPDARRFPTQEPAT
ncbi:MAG: hypothetical protein AMXMBFR76_19670 [Pseudomonadota bacterium]